ncbi:hypothetical protein Q7P35_010363 [Cladosporium inversicolor]
MDPASLGLGAASLAIQVFDGAMKGSIARPRDIWFLANLRAGFEIFEAAANAHKECQGYKIRLRMGYDRLDRWGTITRLNDKSSNHYESQLKNNGPLIIATLTQLGTILKDLRRTELQYDSLDDQRVDTVINSSGATRGSTTKASDISERSVHSSVSAALADVASTQVAVPVERSNVVYRTRAALRRVAKEPKRFKWVLRDSAKFDKGLIHIENLIGFLEEMLSQDQTTSLIKSANDFKLMLLQLTTDVGAMKDLLWAGQSQESRVLRSPSVFALDGATLVDAAEQESTQVQGSRTAAVSKTTAFWIAATRFSIAVNEAPGVTSSSNQLDKSVIGKLEEGLDRDSRTLARMSNGDRVWIEWRTFEHESRATSDGRVRRHVPEDTRKRIEDLVALLHIADKPIEFCVPRCLGYFQDDQAQKFGLIFEPPISDGCWPPTSLLSCFDKKAITLQAKIKIARDLTQWLLYLHAVNWLHKGLRSASVLFFSPADAKVPGQTYVSGFDYSRIVHGHTGPGPAADDVERAMYIHPDYLGGGRKRGFKKTYDMYSIGVILVEIANWRPINEVLGFGLPHLAANSPDAQAVAGAQRQIPGVASEVVLRTRDSHTLPQANMSHVMSFRDKLLNDGFLDQIAATMGGAYAAATRVCLEGMAGLELANDMNQSDVSVAALMQQGFSDKVVDVLGKISV